MKVLRLVVAFAVAAVPVSGWACTFNVLTDRATPESGQNYKISWSAVPGASNYTIIESRGEPADFLKENEVVNGNDTDASFEHFVMSDTVYHYVVRAYSQSDPYDPLCAGKVDVEVQSDTGVRDFVARGIIPVVGSAPGAYGAQFRTYLRLQLTGANTLRGKIVFHPAGQPERDSDPSLTYELSTDVRAQQWDDIVAALGASGIGSLDIVPALGPFNSRTLPLVETRVYNDAPTGTFGAQENVYLPSEVFGGATRTQIINYGDARLRVNVGVRALESRVKATVSVFDSAGNQRGTTKTITIHDNGMYMGSPEAIFGVTFLPGDQMVVQWEGEAFPFHTITENRTNDPYLFVLGTPQQGGVNLSGFTD